MNEGVDWCWCYENPKEAAAEIDRLQKEIALLKEGKPLARLRRKLSVMTDFNGYGVISCSVVASMLDEAFPPPVRAKPSREEAYGLLGDYSKD